MRTKTEVKHARGNQRGLIGKKTHRVQTTVMISRLQREKNEKGLYEKRERS